MARDLVAIVVADPVAEHRQTCPGVGLGEGLAEDVGALEVVPLCRSVVGWLGPARGRALVDSGLADGLGWCDGAAWGGLASEVPAELR